MGTHTLQAAAPQLLGITGLHTQAIDTIENWSEAGQAFPLKRFGILCGLHILLGLLLSGNPTLSTLHALVIGGVATVGILGGARAPWAASMAAYLTGAGVFWRMTEATVFHQYAKYGVVFLLGLWLLRNHRLWLSPGPVIYMALLLPSIALVVVVGGRWGKIQQPISFNLSGPLALAVAVVFFRQAALRREDVLRILAALALPTFAVLAIAGKATLAASKLVFSASNMITSGGFGPNQVSSALGLGCLCLLILLFLLRPSPAGRLFLLAGASLLGLQCALTFSRGGLYSAGGALLAGLPFLFASRRGATRSLLAVGAVVALITFVMLPFLQDFTGGKFLERIQDTHLTGRDELMQRDLSLWTSNAFLGVGPGLSRLTDAEGTKATMAHTEFTRLISEHGALGALAFLALLLMGLSSVRSATPGVPRGLAVCFTVWSLLYMVHAAMRLAAPSFMFGFGAAMAGIFLTSSEEEPEAETPEVQDRRRISPRRRSLVAEGVGAEQ